MLEKKIEKNTPLKNFSNFREWYVPAPRLKNSLYFRKWNFLALILRGFLYFPKRKLFWYFAKWNFLYFRKRKPEKAPYISGKGTLLHFRKRKSRKNALYFRKPNFLIFPENGNFLIFFRERDIQNPGIFRIFILEYLTLPLPASALNFFP